MTFTRIVRVCAMFLKKKLPMLAYLFQIARLVINLLPTYDHHLVVEKQTFPIKLPVILQKTSETFGQVYAV